MDELLGYNPFKYLEVDVPEKYLSETTKKPLKFILQTEEYDILYLDINSNFESLSVVP